MTDFHSKIPGKYRRSFEWRLSRGKRDSIKTDTTAMVRLSTSDFPDILEDFLEISRKRTNNPTALIRVAVSEDLQNSFVQSCGAGRSEFDIHFLPTSSRAVVQICKPGERSELELRIICPLGRSSNSRPHTSGLRQRRRS
jgi:hypothetical protein